MSKYNSTLDHPQTFFVDSGERVSGTSGNFQSAPIILTTINAYDTVVLSQCVIPKSYYNVPSGYNTFTLSENGSAKTITIPAGNYNKNNMIPVLQTLLNAASSTGKTYTITYPNINTQGDTGKYTFTITPWTPGDIYYFQFNSQNMFQQLGFDASTTNTFNTTTGILTSTNVINFQIISSIFITSDMCVEEDVFQEIYNVGTVVSQAYIYFNQTEYDLNSKRLLTNRNNSWTFVLLDQLDRIIDLNGVDWQLSMVFYNRNNYFDLARDDLKIKNMERLAINDKILRDMELQQNAT